MRTSAVFGLLLLCAAQAVTAQGRPIRLVIPFGPGSGSDVAGRFFGDQLDRKSVV